MFLDCMDLDQILHQLKVINKFFLKQKLSTNNYILNYLLAQDCLFTSPNNYCFKDQNKLKCKTSSDLIKDCDIGKYVMIDSDNYLTKDDSYYSMLISPLWYMEDTTKYCLSLYYNINPQNSIDGFKVSFQDYLNSDEMKELETVNGPQQEDKWYKLETELDLTKRKYYRVRNIC
jgi:hypothetical protein